MAAPVSPETVAAIVRLYTEEQMAERDIARSVGVNRLTVRRHLIKAGVLQGDTVSGALLVESPEPDPDPPIDTSQAAAGEPSAEAPPAAATTLTPPDLGVTGTFGWQGPPVVSPAPPGVPRRYAGWDDLVDHDGRGDDGGNGRDGAGYAGALEAPRGIDGDDLDTIAITIRFPTEIVSSWKQDKADWSPELVAQGYPPPNFGEWVVGNLSLHYTDCLGLRLVWAHTRQREREAVTSNGNGNGAH